MSQFGQTLRQLLLQRDIARSDFAQRLGLQPNNLSQIFGGGQKVGANLAAKILAEVHTQDAAELLRAYLLDEVEKVQAANEAVPEDLAGFVQIRVTKSSEMQKASPPAESLWNELPASTAKKLLQYREQAKAEPALWRALEAFVDAMSRYQR